MDNRQSKSGALTNLFGCEERIKDLVQVLLTDSQARICNMSQDVFVSICKSQLRNVSDIQMSGFSADGYGSPVGMASRVLVTRLISI